MCNQCAIFERRGEVDRDFVEDVAVVPLVAETMGLNIWVSHVRNELRSKHSWLVVWWFGTRLYFSFQLGISSSLTGKHFAGG